MKLHFRSIILSVLGITAITLATAGVGIQNITQTKEYDVKVPGKIIQKNIEQLVNSHKDAEERKLFDLFPAAFNAEEVVNALPLVEGFNNSKAGLPEGVRSMWENSLLLVGTSDEGAGIGSGFVVRIQPTSAGYVGYVLTNNHVIADYCDFSGNCPDLFVLHDIGLNTETGDVFRTGNNVLKVRGAKILKTTKTPDLALLEVVFEQSAVNFLKIANVKTNNNGLVGQNAFAIGYPATSRRTSPSRKPIEDQNLVIQRWSEGTIEQIVSPDSLGDLVIHEADILPGNSGSALYDTAGTVIGVNVLLFNARKDLDYYGNTGGCSPAAPTARASVAPSMIAPYMDFLRAL